MCVCIRRITLENGRRSAYHKMEIGVATILLIVLYHTMQGVLSTGIHADFGIPLHHNEQDLQVIFHISKVLHTFKYLLPEMPNGQRKSMRYYFL